MEGYSRNEGKMSVWVKSAFHLVGHTGIESATVLSMSQTKTVRTKQNLSKYIRIT